MWVKQTVAHPHLLCLHTVVYISCAAQKQTYVKWFYFAITVLIRSDHRRLTLGYKLPERLLWWDKTKY